MPFPYGAGHGNAVSLRGRTRQCRFPTGPDTAMPFPYGAGHGNAVSLRGRTRQCRFPTMINPSRNLDRTFELISDCAIENMPLIARILSR
jgi:hypothetical protein